MQQAEDFRAESMALHGLLMILPPEQYAVPTQFKGWTANDILQHLHFWNGMTALQVTDPDRLVSLIDDLLTDPRGMRAFERDFLGDPTGPALLSAWRRETQRIADLFVDIDPKRRMRWAGPDMSARSSMTARLMETWAHGQALYDTLGVTRCCKDRLRNIVVLGLNTFGWSFANRGEPVPDAIPQLTLTAPSGHVWTYGEDDTGGRIAGPAEAFCQVVTQCRNVADTDLEISGENARTWMSRAQCFAGPPQDPPIKGTRYIAPKLS